ncbi:LysR family transcriptional regulator [Bosea psychrotolerans]|uniref:LysR family transcriptional regulator n=1 Tax=Bosea psychrotolerans TaxID=1871628 RepID=A0A2S4MQ58_9HYPH|nr:LysR family transcriptional regulator [Bosea psychrotolerans]POR56874.1 LysR family transcriptional regulator [Bosea psychrotolerans]
MDSRKLGYFASVARAGSFSRAAEELRIAQPALSRRIRELEDELGQPLLVRHGRGVRLTALGASVLQRAEEIEHLLAQIKTDARQDRPALRGSVSLGLPPAAGLLLGPPLAAHMAQAYPEIVLNLREGVSSLIHEWLAEKRIDVGLVYNAMPVDGFRIVPLLRERMVLVGPPGDTRRIGETPEIRIKDIAGLPLIMPSLPHNNRRVLEQAAARHEVRLAIRSEVDSVALTKAMVRVGQGYTILTHASVQAEVARGELSRRAIDNPPILATLALIMRQSTLAEPLARQLGSEIEALLAGLCGTEAWPGATLIPPIQAATPKRRR